MTPVLYFRRISAGHWTASGAFSIRRSAATRRWSLTVRGTYLHPSWPTLADAKRAAERVWAERRAA